MSQKRSLRMSDVLPDRHIGIKSSTGLAWLAGAFVVLSFLPYIAVPLGNSTNVSAAAVIGVMLSVKLMRWPRVTVLLLVFLALPFAASVARMFFTNSVANPNAYFTSVFGIFTLLGAASSLTILRDRIISILRVSISFSAIIAIIQKYVFLDHGIVPWMELYNVPGYASVAANAQTIGLYIRRPFGLFPEPSFLAGTLSLACAALIAVISLYSRRPEPLDWITLALTTFTIYISDSGSGVVCIAILTVAVFVPMARRSRAVYTLLPLAVTAALWLGLSIAASRQDGVNTSWNDRLASIIGGFRLIGSDPAFFLFGVGRGLVPSYFQSGRIPFTNMTVYSYIPDIYSVLGRIVMENGVIFGAPVIIWMAVLILRLVDQRPSILGALILTLWFVIAGLTISYETAAWIWILPGIFFGFTLTEDQLRRGTGT